MHLKAGHKQEQHYASPLDKRVGDASVVKDDHSCLDEVLVYFIQEVESR